MDELPQFPSMPLWINDFFNDPLVLVMSSEAVGVYFKLCGRAWHQKPAGTLPMDESELIRLGHSTRSEWKRVRGSVLACFYKGENRRWHQKGMEKVYAEQVADWKKKKYASQKANAARWPKDENAIRSDVRSDNQTDVRSDVRMDSQSKSNPPLRVGGSAPVGATPPSRPPPPEIRPPLPPAEAKRRHDEALRKLGEQGKPGGVA